MDNIEKYARTGRNPKDFLTEVKKRVRSGKGGTTTTPSATHEASSMANGNISGGAGIGDKETRITN